MTTLQMISDWFDAGVEDGKRHMLIVCDTFSHDDYPVYTKTDDECRDRFRKPGEMQKIMEVYDLTASKQEQMGTNRTFRLPPS